MSSCTIQSIRTLTHCFTHVTQTIECLTYYSIMHGAVGRAYDTPIHLACRSLSSCMPQFVELHAAVGRALATPLHLACRSLSSCMTQLVERSRSRFIMHDAVDRVLDAGDPVPARHSPLSTRALGTSAGTPHSGPALGAISATPAPA